MVNDPARGAAASIRGYWAQIWRSVLAWMDLGEAERLYLEGAEDFDRDSGLGAGTVQVKDVTGNVTLRSSDVIESIDNAWAHRQRNPRHTIKFRFLTTETHDAVTCAFELIFVCTELFVANMITFFFSPLIVGCRIRS
ncbi:MAG TPA: hypothetical protein VE999_07300 [Gemmataceae bacterium]|nr:hypothetical protein [Gemmataceae bacterium]